MVVAGWFQICNFAIGCFYLHFECISYCSDFRNRHRVIPLFQQLIAIVLVKREKQFEILAVVEGRRKRVW